MIKGKTFRELSTSARWSWLLSTCISLAACKSQQLPSQGLEVVTVPAMPTDCEELGVVTGTGGGLLGGYVEKETLIQSAQEDAQKQASELGATHFVAQPAEIQHGTAKAPTRDQQPAMGHGDSSSSTVTVTGIAYRCQPGSSLAASRGPGQAPVAAAPLTAGTASVAPTAASVAPAAATHPGATPAGAAAPAITLQPLGTLRRVTVFHLTPATPHSEAKETEVREIEDAATLQSLASALEHTDVTGMQFVPTYRIEFIGELGTQSLLYGFGHLTYAGHSYRLQDPQFEETLGLVKAAQRPKK